MDTSSIRLHASLLLAVVSALGAQRAPGASSTEQTPVVLTPDAVVERELTGGESHLYDITLVAGQFMRAVVDQRGINVIVTIYGPDQAKIVDLDSPVGGQGPEPLSLVADTTGTYRLEIRPLQKTAPAGRYIVRIVEVRAATNADNTRVAAERTIADATFLAAQSTAESRRKSIQKYREAIPLWQTLGNGEQEAFTLTAVGHIHALLAENQTALEYFTRALSRSRAVGDRKGEALALYSTALVYASLGEQQKGLELLHLALPIYRTSGDRSMEAATLGSIGSAYVRAGEYQQALTYYQQALEIKREVGDPLGEATLLNNMGFVAFNSGDHQRAIESYTQALPLYRRVASAEDQATTLNNIAAVHEDLGDLENALDLYKQVVEIKRQAGSRGEVATALNNVGRVHNSLGAHQKALEFFNQSLPLSRAIGARSTEAVGLANIGTAYSQLGDNRRAIEFYNQALAIQQQIGERRAEAKTLASLGKAHHDSGEHERGLQILGDALAVSRAVGDRSAEAVILYNLARARRDLNQLADARAHFEAARVIVESQRTKLANQGLRTSYLASTQQYYELGIDVLMRLHAEHPSEGFDAAALQTSESARARGLLELLTESRADIRQGVPSAMLEKERSLQRSLDTAAAAQTRLLSGTHSADQAAAAAKEIDRLTREYEDTKAEIRQNSPRYAALTQPMPLTAHEIQARLLGGDEETVLLEYALGDERSFLWAVTTHSISSFQLPSRAQIEVLARRVYDLLNAPNRIVDGETSAARQRRLALANSTYSEASAALSDVLLGPVASQLGARRLVIVADGILQYIPFGALAVPERHPRAQTAYTPLLVAHEVVSLPSASVLAMLRQELSGREPASQSVAVLADPVFYPDDARVRRHAAAAAPPSRDPVSSVRRSAAESGLGDFVRLRFSRQEAEQIARLAPDGATLTALDFDASRTIATSGDLERYGIVHFATHGLINSRHPGLSGIVLSLVDREGRPQDGFLRLHEIYNLRLRADLVVLSACQTALGKEVKGEGLVGLTRGFMYAGAPRVVASLWKIDDQATAALMRQFYEGMLARGLTAAAALRAAQLAMWKDKRWAAPHHWAAFTLQGEWK
jgi:CHAT domain-containing protein/tetratricopeptide (TPR) repeat protein